MAVFLSSVPLSDLPPCFTCGYYFDFNGHPYRHAALFSVGKDRSVIGVLDRIGDYIAVFFQEYLETDGTYSVVPVPEKTTVIGNVVVRSRGKISFNPQMLLGPSQGNGAVYVDGNAAVHGAVLDVSGGDISIGKGTNIGPGAVIEGPAVIGGENEIRPSSYFRGNILTGDCCVFRCEAKNAVFLDQCQFPHPAYVGDSIMGFRAHFGNQATTANISVFNAMAEEDKRTSIVLRIGGVSYDTGRMKIGMIMGDHSQAGCGSVSDPGVFLGPRTVVYPLTRLKAGCYGPDVIIKNDPEKAGVISVEPLEDRS